MWVFSCPLCFELIEKTPNKKFSATYHLLEHTDVCLFLQHLWLIHQPLVIDLGLFVCLFQGVFMASCPSCHSHNLKQRAIGRTVAGSIGGLAGGAAGISGALNGARTGAMVGVVAGPIGSVLGSIAGAALGGLLGGKIGCEVGSALGDNLDANVLDNIECIDCGHTFRL
ncbi:hypothetical protein [Lampropedia aestuarii]|uniref:hypothetical protein n=1 Tax=Lampropedia aestuarii TaxID=2562762 RepID=UPI002468EBD2|nr:hypothetical protein [Lampropedia aestuarii]MDH5856454.1 hypothetical protein [Lampropedia aestuarii]